MPTSMFNGMGCVLLQTPTLSQLEDVLLAVNDLQGATPHQLCNVACVEEAVLV